MHVGVPQIGSWEVGLLSRRNDKNVKKKKKKRLQISPLTRDDYGFGNTKLPLTGAAENPSCQVNDCMTTTGYSTGFFFPSGHLRYCNQKKPKRCPETECAAALRLVLIGQCIPMHHACPRGMMGSDAAALHTLWQSFSTAAPRHTSVP